MTKTWKVTRNFMLQQVLKATAMENLYGNSRLTKSVTSDILWTVFL